MDRRRNHDSISSADTEAANKCVRHEGRHKLLKKYGLTPNLVRCAATGVKDPRDYEVPESIRCMEDAFPIKKQEDFIPIPGMKVVNAPDVVPMEHRWSEEDERYFRSIGINRL